MHWDSPTEQFLVASMLLALTLRVGFAAVTATIQWICHGNQEP